MDDLFAEMEEEQARGVFTLLGRPVTAYALCLVCALAMVISPSCMDHGCGSPCASTADSPAAVQPWVSWSARNIWRWRSQPFIVCHGSAGQYRLMYGLTISPCRHMRCNPRCTGRVVPTTHRCSAAACRIRESICTLVVLLMRVRYCTLRGGGQPARPLWSGGPCVCANVDSARRFRRLCQCFRRFGHFLA